MTTGRVVIFAAACLLGAACGPRGGGPVDSSVSVQQAAGDSTATVEALDSTGRWTRYRAGGNEPFWTLTISGNVISFEQLGMRAGVADIGPPETVADGWRVGGGTSIVADIRRIRCNDSMSGQPFPHTVTVAYNGQQFSGCGGDTSTLLTGTTWTVTALDGTPITGERAPTLAFAADSSVTGTGGCNRYRSVWKLTGEGMSIGPAAATKMACAGDGIGAREVRFFELLAQVSRFDIAADGALMLYVQDRPVIVASHR